MKQYPNSNDLKLLTFSYLPGNVLYHKICLTSMSIRNQVPRSGLLDQVIVVTVKQMPDGSPAIPSHKSLKYVTKLADTIQIQVKENTLSYIKWFHALLQSYIVDCDKPVKLPIIDVVFKLKEEAKETDNDTSEIDAMNLFRALNIPYR